MKNLLNIKGLLVDLEGVLYNDNHLIPGSIETVKELKKEGLKLRFLTNTTTASRKTILDKLLNFGFDIEEKEIFTPIIATKNFLRDNTVKKISLVTNIEVIEEFRDYETVAREKGFLMVSASPLTRSSYHADKDFESLKIARQKLTAT